MLPTLRPPRAFETRADAWPIFAFSPRTPATVVPDLEKYASEVKKQVGEHRWLGYNLAMDVKGTGTSSCVAPTFPPSLTEHPPPPPLLQPDKEIAGFTDKLAKLGYVWQVRRTLPRGPPTPSERNADLLSPPPALQFLPLAGMSSLAVGVEKGARAIRDRGILGLMKDVYEPGKAANCSVLDKTWQGGDLSDASVAAVTMIK